MFVWYKELFGKTIGNILRKLLETSWENYWKHLGKTIGNILEKLLETSWENYAAFEIVGKIIGKSDWEKTPI